MIPLLRRIVTERRVVVVPLAALALVNLALYAFVVYPLSLRVAGIESRTAAARASRLAAEREHGAAQAMLTSKARADVELERFYTKVLPSDLAAARRMTYARLAQLARDSGLLADRRTYEPDDHYDGNLAKLRITMVLEGEYSNVREFIHKLETSPEFVVIEDVALSEGSDEGAPLALTLQLATYYRPSTHGT